MANWYYDPVNGDDSASGDSWTIEASGTDGVCDGTTKFTSATGGFTGKEGRYIRIGTAVHKIVTVVSDTEVTLHTTMSAGSGRAWAIGGAVQTETKLQNDLLADGDLIKYPKTGGWESAGTITYTSKSDEVVIGSGRVAIIDDCESLWTGETNVNATLNTTGSYLQFGTGSLKMQLLSAFTTGKMAYFDFGEGNEKDLSAFQGVSMLMRLSSSLQPGGLQLCLCSDATGDVVVDTIDLIPGGQLYTSMWVAPRGFRSGGGNLGSSIRSIAFYAAQDPGTPTCYIDNIVAIKAEADPNHICHNCLIGQGNTISDVMWAVEGFTDATHVKLVGEWYGGTEGAVASYRVEPAYFWGNYFRLASRNPSLGYGQEVVNSGGWNTSTDIQDGVTCWRIMASGGSSYAQAVSSPSLDFWAVENFIFDGFSLGRYLAGVRIENCGFAGRPANNSCGLHCSNSTYTGDGYQCHTVLRNVWAAGIDTYGIYWANSGLVGTYSDQNIDQYWENVTVYSTAGIQLGDVRRFRGRNLKVGNNNYSGYNSIYAHERVLDLDIDGLELTDHRHVTYAGMHFNCCTGRVRIRNLVASGNINATFNASAVEIVCVNPDIDDATLYKTDDLLQGGSVTLLKKDGDAEVHESYLPRGTIKSETSVRHTASGIAWKISPTDSRNLPISHKLAEIAVEAGIPVTIGLYMRRDNTGVNAQLRIPGGWLTGMTQDDYVASITAAENIWELVSTMFTPTETGVIEVWVDAWGGTTHSVYIDDLSVTV